MDDTLLHLRDPHVLPLTILIERMRDRCIKVPHIDPRDGGITAQAIIFLETPGPQAKNGFVSRDNDDPTAQNFNKVCKCSGIDRKITALWNVVPQCLSARPTDSQIRDAIPDTAQFIQSFVALKAIVFCGGSAKYAMKRLTLGSLKVFPTYHTGRKAFNRPRLQNHIRSTFCDLAVWLNAN